MVIGDGSLSRKDVAGIVISQWASSSVIHVTFSRLPRRLLRLTRITTAHFWPSLFVSHKLVLIRSFRGFRFRLEFGFVLDQKA